MLIKYIIINVYLLDIKWWIKKYLINFQSFKISSKLIIYITQIINIGIINHQVLIKLLVNIFNIKFNV